MILEGHGLVNPHDLVQDSDLELVSHRDRALEIKLFEKNLETFIVKPGEILRGRELIDTPLKLLNEFT